MRKIIIIFFWIIPQIVISSSFGGTSTVDLSPEEKSWISKGLIVRIRIGNSPPFMIVGGDIRGIAIDYLTTIFDSNNIKYQYILESEVTWLQALKYIEQHDVVDMVPTAKITEDRRKHMAFTDEYIFAPWVIFTNSNTEFISSIDDLKGKTVAVEEGYVIHQLLKRHYPEIKLKIASATLNNYAEIPIRDLSTGLVDAYVGNLLSTTYLIQTNGYSNVKVAAPTPFENHNQAMAIRDDWPELVSIINKTLAAMTPTEHAVIRNKWLAVRYEHGISIQDVLKWLFSVAGVAVFFIGWVLIWNKRLKSEVNLRKSTEKALLERESELEEAQFLAGTGSWTYDPDTQKSIWSKGMFKIWGLDPSLGVYPGEDHKWHVHPDDYPQFEAVLKKAIDHGVPYKMELRLKHPGTIDKTIVTICQPQCDSTGKVVKLRGTVQDITEHKQAEEKIRETNEYLENLLNYANVPIIVWDMYFKITRFNHAFEEITGRNAKAVKGESLTILFPPAQIDKSMALIKQTMAGDRWKHIEIAIQKIDGSIRTVLWNSATIFASDGVTPVAVIAQGYDITERIRDEEEKKKLTAQLQQAQKMEAIGGLAGGIAHDFNNILGAIIGYAEMIRDDCRTGSVNANDVNQVLNAGMRAKELVKQILAFSRQAEVDLIPLQPGLVIKEAINLLRSSLPTTITIKQDIDAESGVILANPGQIHQIMLNLCTNAFHAMETSGGVLTISLHKKNLVAGDLKVFPTLQPGNYVQLSIKDTGVGITPEIREKIFDPFFTTKQVGQGTGMGLSIVHGIVQSYGGTIFCHSEPGQGSEFRITLPIIEETDLQESEASVLVPHAEGKEHILLIDDEEMLLEMGQRLLKRLGYKVTAKTNSLDALTAFQNQPQIFDLVITDQTMPVMTGIDLARRMLQMRPELPVILCTGYSNLISEEKVKDMGIKGFAMKPLVKKEIAELIRKTLDVARLKRP